MCAASVTTPGQTVLVPHPTYQAMDPLEKGQVAMCPTFIVVSLCNMPGDLTHHLVSATTQLVKVNSLKICEECIAK